MVDLSSQLSLEAMGYPVCLGASISSIAVTAKTGKAPLFDN